MAAAWNKGRRAKRGFKWFYNRGKLIIEEGPPGLGCCWLWMGTQKDNGYGIIQRPANDTWKKKVTSTAQRHFFELYRRRLAESEEAAHRCHRRLCVRPSHLYAASHEQNVHDWRAMAPSDPESIAKIKSMLFEGFPTSHIADSVCAPRYAIRRLASDLLSPQEDFFYDSDTRPADGSSLPDSSGADCSNRPGEEEPW